MRTLKTWGAALALMAMAGAAQAASVPGLGTWEATLQARDMNGDTVVDAYYDTALNITWVANANAGAGSRFDDGSSTTDGRMTWVNANAWAESLDVLGVTGWRLPTVSPINGISFNENPSNNGSTDSGYAKTGVGWGTASELGHLYYVTLGNKGYCTPDDALPSQVDPCAVQSGWGLGNTGPFTDLQSFSYWSGTASAPFPIGAWAFVTLVGSQNADNKSNSLYAVAVRAGDVAAIPEPPAVVLALAGLVVVVMKRRQRRR